MRGGQMPIARFSPDIDYRPACFHEAPLPPTLRSLAIAALFAPATALIDLSRVFLGDSPMF